MKKRDLWARISGLGFFYRWHPSIAIRYLPFVEAIRSLGRSTTILEVGSAGLGIAPYIKRPVTGIDLSFEPPYHSLLSRVIGSATHIPFADRSFDIVVSMDMLEHTEKKDRQLAIEEMVRVAKRKVLIGVPCGKEAWKQDQLLDAYYQKRFGRRFHFLEEQIGFVLPEVHDIVTAIEDAARRQGREVKLYHQGNENLRVHEFLMKGWMSKNAVANLFFRKILLLAVPLLWRINKRPTYRELFFVDFV